MLPSIIQENFLTADEIEFIKNHVLEFGWHYDDYIQNQLHGYYKPWPYYNSKFKEVRDILDPKFQKYVAGLHYTQIKLRSIDNAVVS